MRFSVAVVAGFAAMASAATTSASVDAAQASQIACLDKCDAGDVDCQSHCITVPSPNKAQANKTTECVANCDQGDGSKADTEAYSKCVQSCISDNYYVTGSGTPQQTGSSDSSSKDSSNKSKDSTATATAASSGSETSGADSTKTGSSDSESSGTATGTATGTASTATSSDNAAAGVVLGSTGLLGLIAAVLAL